jgi:hypothetical protein
MTSDSRIQEIAAEVAAAHPLPARYEDLDEISQRRLLAMAYRYGSDPQVIYEREIAPDDSGFDAAAVVRATRRR